MVGSRNAFSGWSKIRSTSCWEGTRASRTEESVSSAMVGVTTSPFAKMNGRGVMIVRRWGDLVSRAISSKASRYCVYSVVSGDRTTKRGRRTAVATSDSSVSSYFPPGKAVWPGCERRFFDRVVNNTLNDPSLSNNKTNTAARLLAACVGLNRKL
jgi:hypothetical protein